MGGRDVGGQAIIDSSEHWQPCDDGVRRHPAGLACWRRGLQYLMFVVFAGWLRAPFQLSCVDMHKGWSVSAEQLDMPDGIVCVASTPPTRERDHDPQIAADSRKIMAPQQDD